MANDIKLGKLACNKSFLKNNAEYTVILLVILIVVVIVVRVVVQLWQREQNKFLELLDWADKKEVWMWWVLSFGTY